MANLPLISQGQVEVVIGDTAAPRISRGQVEVVMGDTAAPRISRMQVEAIVLLDGPIPEPGGGARAYAVWVNLGL